MEIHIVTRKHPNYDPMSGIVWVNGENKLLEVTQEEIKAFIRKKCKGVLR